LRDQGRVTRGVRGIRLKPKDQVDNFLVVDDSKLLLIAGRNGLGIRTKFSAFLPNGGKVSDSDQKDQVTPRKRGGQGVTAMNTEAIVGALSVSEESEVLMITAKGQAVRCPVLNIRETNRGSKGVKLVNLSDGDKLIGISEVVELDEENLESDDTNSSEPDESASEPEDLVDGSVSTEPDGDSSVEPEAVDDPVGAPEEDGDSSVEPEEESDSSEKPEQE
ncbi:hypothetical protein OAK38_09590, partial [Verrucomicrobia bacterium]|nr:hypothetical protein [Verrucomicrobiota bacterium]